jgi:hypothetical protein
MSDWIDRLTPDQRFALEALAKLQGILALIMSGDREKTAEALDAMTTVGPATPSSPPGAGGIDSNGEERKGIFRAVLKKGVMVLFRYYWSTELINYIGRTIRIEYRSVSPDEIQCYDLDTGGFICEARAEPPQQGAAIGAPTKREQRRAAEHAKQIGTLETVAEPKKRGPQTGSKVRISDEIREYIVEAERQGTPRDVFVSEVARLFNRTISECSVNVIIRAARKAGNLPYVEGPEQRGARPRITDEIRQFVITKWAEGMRPASIRREVEALFDRKFALSSLRRILAAAGEKEFPTTGKDGRPANPPHSDGVDAPESFPKGRQPPDTERTIDEDDIPDGSEEEDTETDEDDEGSDAVTGGTPVPPEHNGQDETGRLKCSLPGNAVMSREGCERMGRMMDQMPPAERAICRGCGKYKLDSTAEARG